MAYTTIDDPSAHFQTALYAGDSSNSTVISNDGNSNLQPDFIWIKNRTSSGGNVSNNMLFNSSVGIGTGANSPYLMTDSTAAEATNSNALQAVSSNGFTPGSMTRTNETGKNFVAWQWKANGGTTASNTDGNITATVQANPAAGFSIVTYTGQGTQTGKTVGHGLGAVPKMIISKDRNASSNVPHWRVYHESIGNTKYLTLQGTNAASTYNDWDNTTPTSSVYSVGGAGGYTPTNNNNTPYVAYVFAEVKGYSKFGTYIGNGNADGPFAYTGFKPAFLIIKESSSAGGNWVMFDNKRDTHNVTKHRMFPNLTNSDNTTRNYIDLLSNGFKLRDTDADHNQSGQTMIYMAFAESPLVTSTGVPTTAR